MPVSRFMDLIAWVADMNATGPLRVNAFGHAGDGNLHVSFLSMSGDPAEKRLIHEGVEKLFRKTLELHWEFDEATWAAMKAAKSVLDPENLLNPGKIFAD